MTRHVPRTCGVHPRVRGEQSTLNQAIRECSGSIPACAGSSGGWLRWSWRVRVHPRVRGEQFSEIQ